MTKKVKKLETVPDQMDDVDYLICEVLQKEGFILPQTEAEVERAEQEMLENCEKPSQLLIDPAVIIARIRSGSQEVFNPHPTFDEAAEQLGRAAREGSDISSDIEKRMQKDRENAEAELIQKWRNHNAKR